MSRTWTLQDAKNRFSEVVNHALSEGPQTVTKRGVETVVVLSVSEYRKLLGEQPSFLDYLLSGPSLEGLDLERDKSPGRDIDL